MSINCVSSIFAFEGFEISDGNLFRPYNLGLHEKKVHSVSVLIPLEWPQTHLNINTGACVTFLFILHTQTYIIIHFDKINQY